MNESLASAESHFARETVFLSHRALLRTTITDPYPSGDSGVMVSHFALKIVIHSPTSLA
jgi:hypothetical protein